MKKRTTTLKLFKWVLFSLSILALSFSLTPAHAKDEKKDADEAAESESAPGSFRCETDVFYVWKRAPRPPENGRKIKLEGEFLKPVEVFYSRPGASAATEALARGLLKSELAKEKTLALQTCQRLRESESKCVMRSLQASNSEYRMMDFQSRKRFLDSVAEDCQINTGICLNAKASEFECRAELTADAASKDGDTKDEDDKKKKKK